jgi:hypothetical protein
MIDYYNDGRKPFSVTKTDTGLIVFCSPRPEDPTFYIDIFISDEQLNESSVFNIVCQLTDTLNREWNS